MLPEVAVTVTLYDAGVTVVGGFEAELCDVTPQPMHAATDAISTIPIRMRLRNRDAPNNVNPSSGIPMDNVNALFDRSADVLAAAEMVNVAVTAFDPGVTDLGETLQVAFAGSPEHAS